MEPSSRTPEGEPNRCPVCGGRVRLEPSQPAGDAPCPHCGCLMWFGRASAEGIDPLEQASGGPFDRSRAEETKQIIRDWVAHIKALSRSRVPPAEYFRELVDGLVRTLAARGGALWLGARGRLRLEYHVGLDSVGFSEKDLRKPPHIRWVNRVSSTGVCCAVPPRSSSRLAPQVTNPTDSLLLLCPVEHAFRTEGVVEIFQRTGTRSATQRAYLRYIEEICYFAGGSHFFCPVANRPWWRLWW